MSRSHEAQVEGQFGARAGAYLTRSVHAQGMGLAELVALAEARKPARLLDMGCGGGFTIDIALFEAVKPGGGEKRATPAISLSP